MSLWMCLFYGRLTSLLAAQQAVPFHQPILPCTVAHAQSSSRCQHQLQDLSLPQHRLKANAQPQGWGEALFSIFLPCFLPPFQTPACLWQTALVCRASGSQGNAECWCPHFCFQGSKVPKSTVVANVLTPLLCRHHTLHKPEASSCPLCKCSPQDSTHSPCSSVTIHYSSQLLEQAYELTAEKQHHPYAMESCLRQKIKWNKIKDKTLPPNISCSPSLCHSSTRFTNSKLNYRSEKKDSYSPSENRSHTLPRTSDDQPQDQDSTLVIPACSASSDKATSVRGLQGTLPSSTLKIATRAHYTSSSWWTKAQQLQSS